MELLVLESTVDFSSASSTTCSYWCPVSSTGLLEAPAILQWGKWHRESTDGTNHPTHPRSTVQQHQARWLTASPTAARARTGHRAPHGVAAVTGDDHESSQSAGMRWRPAGRGSLPLSVSDRLARRGSVSTSRVVRSTPAQPSSQLSTHHAPLPVLLILPRARLTADRGTGCRHASSLPFSRSPSQASPSSPPLRSSVHTGDGELAA